MALPFTILSDKSGGTRSDESARGRLMRLAFVVFSIIHIGACIWFYMGSQYAVSSLQNCRFAYKSFVLVYFIQSQLTRHVVFLRRLAVLAGGDEPNRDGFPIMQSVGMKLTTSFILYPTRNMINLECKRTPLCGNSTWRRFTGSLQQ
jgi:hypothetical protein